MSDWRQAREHRNLRVVCVLAQHFGGRSLSDMNSRLWASWQEEADGDLDLLAQAAGPDIPQDHLRESETENHANPVLDLGHQGIRQGTDLLPEGFVGDSNQLTQEEIAFMRYPALPLLHAQPEDAGVLNQPGGCGDHDGGGITRVIHKIRLEHDGGPELTRLCFDAWIEVYDVQVAALDFHSAITDATRYSCRE
jgi:hypothetical protein